MKKLRLIALWRILTSRNFILIEVKDKNPVKHSRHTRVLYRTDFEDEDDLITLDHSRRLLVNRIDTEKLFASKDSVVINGLSYTREQFNGLAERFESDGGM